MAVNWAILSGWDQLSIKRMNGKKWLIAWLGFIGPLLGLSQARLELGVNLRQIGTSESLVLRYDCDRFFFYGGPKVHNNYVVKDHENFWFRNRGHANNPRQIWGGRLGVGFRFFQAPSQKISAFASFDSQIARIGLRHRNLVYVGEVYDLRFQQFYPLYAEEIIVRPKRWVSESVLSLGMEMKLSQRLSLREELGFGWIIGEKISGEEIALKRGDMVYPSISVALGYLFWSPKAQRI